MQQYSYLVIIALMFVPGQLICQSIKINEVCSNNHSYADEDGDFEDWIELYNASGQNSSLIGWSITDKLHKPNKWVFAQETIATNDFLILFASGKDRRSSLVPHTNFKISGGETIYLFDQLGQLHDSLQIPDLESDLSVGLFPDGVSNNRIFKKSTPDIANSTENYAGFLEKTVEFSKVGGYYSTSFNLVLSGTEEGEIIRYTVDGSDPETNSTMYQAPIKIDETRLIKARIFKEDFLSRKPTTNTYFINQQHELPIVSIAVNPKDFFDETAGIYSFGENYEEEFPYIGANFWKDVEKPIHISLFEKDGQNGFSANAGVKIFGGWSRGLAQRSLSIFFRRKYGDKKLEYPLFEDRDYTDFEAFILRNSGNDWQRTMLRDLTLTGLMMDSELDIQAGYPVVTYLNGDYWGIYNLREKINEHYLSSLHNVPTEGLNILEGFWHVIYGSNVEYSDMMNFVEQNDLGIDANYKKVSDQIDIANYIQYQLAQIYFNNTDWPSNNSKFWKAKNGKWRWILFDTDSGFGTWRPEDYTNNTLSFALESNGPVYPNPPWATLLFRQLIENTNFKRKFINTFADEINTRFLQENVKDAIDKNANRIRSEMPAQVEKWGVTGVDDWEIRVMQMKNFAEKRPEMVRNHIQDQFNLPQQKEVSISIDNPNWGNVQLNTIQLNSANWTGIYFESIPITLTAIPEKDYVFDHWSGTSSSTEATITVDPGEEVKLTAHFSAAMTTSTVQQNDFSESILVTPNPFHEQLSIQIDLPKSAIIRIDLMSIMGKKLQELYQQKNTKNGKIYLQMPSVPSGNYLLRIQVEESIVMKKIIKL